MARKIKRVVEYYTDERTGQTEITQTKSIISKSSEIGVDANAQPPDLKNLWEFPEDKRGATRHEACFDVAIIRNGVTFRTKTINVSTAGVLLVESIPSVLVNQVFEMMMTFKEVVNGQTVQHVFPLMAKALGSPFKTPRVQFVTIAPPVKEKLAKCLVKFKKVV